MEFLPEIIAKSDSLETDKNKPKRSSSSSSNSIIFPNLSIFCNKDVKYKKKLEQLRECAVKQVWEDLENCAKEKNYYRVISLVSIRDIVAAEAKYHPSCYTYYTRPKKLLKPKDNQSSEYKKLNLKPFI